MCRKIRNVELANLADGLLDGKSLHVTGRGSLLARHACQRVSLGSFKNALLQGSQGQETLSRRNLSLRMAWESYGGA